MSIKTVRDVSEKTWLELKAIAAKHGLPIAKLLEFMVSDYARRSDEFWDRVLKGEKTLSDSEAKELKNEVRKIREEHGFR